MSAFFMNILLWVFEKKFAKHKILDSMSFLSPANQFQCPLSFGIFSCGVLEGTYFHFTSPLSATSMFQKSFSRAFEEKRLQSPSYQSLIYH